MQYSASQPSAGWYPDPAGSGDERYWDGSSWSEVTRPDSRHTALPHGPEVLGSHGGNVRTRTAGGYADWGSRVGAYLLDWLILAIPSWLLLQWLAPGLYERIETWLREVASAADSGMIFPTIPEELVNSAMAASIAVTLLNIFYRTFLLTGFGATLGKMIMGIHVAGIDDPSARTPGFVRALGRTLIDELIGSLSAGLLFLPTVISYLMPLFTEKKQTLHDMMAGTVVVKN